LFAHYSSYFYRNIFLKMTDREINNFFSLSVPGDRSYPILFMKYGKLYVLPEEMSVYRYMSCPTSFTCQKENHSIYTANKTRQICFPPCRYFFDTKQYGNFKKGM
ncbi:MAG: hypothetical protein PUK38_03310, partial [Coriobacteriaceae bacterium]|nr:hypothetical protein [Coriobacteriaceae bacterium]